MIPTHKYTNTSFNCFIRYNSTLIFRITFYTYVWNCQLIWLTVWRSFSFSVYAFEFISIILPRLLSLSLFFHALVHFVSFTCESHSGWIRVCVFFFYHFTPSLSKCISRVLLPLDNFFSFCSHSNHSLSFFPPANLIVSMAHSTPLVYLSYFIHSLHCCYIITIIICFVMKNPEEK